MKISNELRKFILGSFVLIFIISCIYILFVGVSLNWDWKETGVFGDSFGGLTSIFTGLAFAGVIYSMLQQNKVIEEQERQIKEQETKSKEDKKERHKERFENTFFKLLDAKDNMVIVLNGTDHRGYFQVQYGYFHNEYITKQPSDFVSIRKFFHNRQWEVGHYFRNLILILELIDRDMLDKSDYKFYIRVFQARLSNDELRFFFYFIMSELTTMDFPNSIRREEIENLRSIIAASNIFGNPLTKSGVNMVFDSDLDTMLTILQAKA